MSTQLPQTPVSHNPLEALVSSVQSLASAVQQQQHQLQQQASSSASCSSHPPLSFDKVKEQLPVGFPLVALMRDIRTRFEQLKTACEQQEKYTRLQAAGQIPPCLKSSATSVQFPTFYRKSARPIEHQFDATEESLDAAAAAAAADQYDVSNRLAEIVAKQQKDLLEWITLHTKKCKELAETRVTQNALRSLVDTAVLEYHAHYQGALPATEVEAMARATGSLLYKFIDQVRLDLHWKAQSRLAKEVASKAKRDASLQAAESTWASLSPMVLMAVATAQSTGALVQKKGSRSDSQPTSGTINLAENPVIGKMLAGHQEELAKINIRLITSSRSGTSQPRNRSGSRQESRQRSNSKASSRASSLSRHSKSGKGKDAGKGKGKGKSKKGAGKGKNKNDRSDRSASNSRP
eukprot:6157209-Amphidinium_carterae.1